MHEKIDGEYIDNPNTTTIIYICVVYSVMRLQQINTNHNFLFFFLSFKIKLIPKAMIDINKLLVGGRFFSFGGCMFVTVLYSGR